MSEDSYHGQPILKRPVWTWEVPTYFFFGGLAGASAGLAWLAELDGDDALARRAWAAAMVGIGASPPLLIADLGRPERFLNMLRVFKVTSPMSVGSWVLSGSGTATAVAAARAWLGWFPRLGRAASPAAALLGLPLATYTAALLANTANPTWHEARWELPFVFAAGACASAAGASLLGADPQAAGAPRRLAVGAAICELAASETMVRRLGMLGEPYEQGRAARMHAVARGCLAAGAACVAAGRRSRPVTTLGGALLMAGAMATRWCVFDAGRQAADDPRYVVEPQRARRAGRERTATRR